MRLAIPGKSTLEALPVMYVTPMSSMANAVVDSARSAKVGPSKEGTSQRDWSLDTKPVPLELPAVSNTPVVVGKSVEKVLPAM